VETDHISNRMAETMEVIKRDGRKEPVDFGKVLTRIKSHSGGLSINSTYVAQQVLGRIIDGIKTSELDEITAKFAESLSTTHPDYGVLAARIAISNHQKCTASTFLEAMEQVAAIKDRRGLDANLLAEDFLAIVRSHAELIESKIVYDRDFLFDYFGFKTFEKAYLLQDKLAGRVIERPQHLWMRVAVGIWGYNLEKAFKTYELLSTKQYTHATPTLFNAGTKRPQLSSCFLLSMSADSIKGIYKTLEDCALISQYGGGIGVHCHNIRAAGSLIRGTGGTSNGILPMLRVFNNTARYVDQGGGKRNGSFAFYLEPWHADVEAFLDMKKNTGAEEERARDLFYALWIPDLFMERVDSNGSWTLMCPDECPGLADAIGPAFKALYEKYEAEGRGRKTIPAQTLWFKILDSQIETGTPYLVYKDAANLKSNQQNLGTIKSSNLCSEVIEYSSPEETAVCNLASMNLPAYVKDGVFEFKRFRSVVKHVVESLNKVIDINFYPIPEAKYSNMRHRPIGIGVQGLADVFALLRIPWESPEAAALNKKIFAHMYYAAVESSMDCAVAEGVYETYKGSPASMGKLQFTLWGQEPLADPELDWDLLLHMMEKTGLRNSLLIAPMPTASTAQILGNTESIEPVQQNLFTRRTLAGEFFMVNRHLIHALVKLGVWTPELKDKIVAKNGSVQGLAEVPADLQAVFKTVWELKMKTIIDLAADRGPYVCQSQSLNLFISDPTYAKLTSMHFYAWRKGLKTGIYYLRTRAAVGAQKFTVEPSTAAAAPKVEEKECTMCSS